MYTAKCDGCGKEADLGSNEFTGDFFDTKLWVIEPTQIFKKRIEYARETLKGDSGDIHFKRRKEFEFCSVGCLKKFVITKLDNVFDDWKQSVDSYKPESVDSSP